MSSKLIKTDEAYRSWIREISSRFRKSQIKAAVKVNDEMLRFYWSLGRELAEKKSASGIGNDFYHQVSKDLQNLLPDLKSFSPTNLKYMQYFYELYASPQVVDSAVNPLSPQAVDSPDMLFSVPWGHHRYIIDKCKGNQEKALFYVRKTMENNWSRAVLLNFLDTDLYERQGRAVTNFDLTLPAEKSDLAQEITKDPYNFDFLTIREKYDERELKDALMDNITRFLLELLICRSKDNVKARYALEASSQPMGISQYDISTFLPEEYKGSLPTIEEIEAELADPEGGQEA